MHRKKTDQKIFNFHRENLILVPPTRYFRAEWWISLRASLGRPPVIFGVPSARAPVRAELPEARDTQVLVYRWHSMEPTETRRKTSG